jgi:hypothetical protein
MWQYPPRRSIVERINNLPSVIFGDGLLNGTVTWGPRSNLPYDNITRLDSRAWDPDWRYREEYGVLRRIWGDKIATRESYYWGRTQAPRRMFAWFIELPADRFMKKVKKWVRDIRRGGDNRQRKMNILSNLIGVQLPVGSYTSLEDSDY